MRRSVRWHTGQTAVVLTDVVAGNVAVGIAVAAHVEEAAFVVVAVVVLIDAALVAVVEVKRHAVEIGLRLAHLVELENNILAEIRPDSRVPLLYRIVVRLADEIPLHDGTFGAPENDAIAANPIEAVARDVDVS